METTREFNDRRAVEEKFLAEQATDSVQVIPHEQLAKLHADKAEAIATDTLPQGTPLDVKAIDGNVIIATADEVTSLTPEAAFRTADRLSTQAHDAGRQKLSL